MHQGSKISVLNLDGKIIKVSGTSFAAPHTTASVALLQEFGDRQLKQKQSHWSEDSRRHEVMKAVLFNSADKIQDTGDGLSLGMHRTTLNKHNHTWLDSDAYQNPKIPLDIQMGTGHLNVFRAYQQFSAGQWNSATSVPAIGWNYQTLSAHSSQDYVLDSPLQGGSFASITLAWDRLVELNDQNNNQHYDLGESFSDRGLNNLNVYLMPIDTNHTLGSACSSTSDVDSVEHIFCRVPHTGRYKIRVEYRNKVHQETQAYALAWWTMAAKN